MFDILEGHWRDVRWMGNPDNNGGEKKIVGNLQQFFFLWWNRFQLGVQDRDHWCEVNMFGLHVNFLNSR